MRFDSYPYPLYGRKLKIKPKITQNSTPLLIRLIHINCFIPFIYVIRIEAKIEDSPLTIDNRFFVAPHPFSIGGFYVGYNTVVFI